MRRSAPRSPAPDAGAVAVSSPAARAAPLVLASPHGGRRYDPAFLAGVRLCEATLRRSEDAYVEELFAGAPALGAPLVAARFPRVFIDPNRAPFELDPAMFAEPLPRWVDRHSPRVRLGLGLIPRIAANGAPIYAGPLSRAEVRRRLAGCYLPYHRALKRELRETRNRFGHAILLDCHSMPSHSVVPRRAGWGGGAPPGVDMVLGDRHGAACRPELADTAEAALRAFGFSVVRNAPYAGGFATGFYGRPRRGVQALQIEVNRALYMDEARLAPRAADMASLARALDRLVAALAALYPVARAAE